MNQFDAKKSRLKFDTNEGWMVQVYGRDRRLLWVLEPSPWVDFFNGLLRWSIVISHLGQRCPLQPSG
jgi:hypothetical protein